MKTLFTKIFFVISSVLLIFTHTISLLYMTDTATGFFKPEYKNFRLIFGIVTFLFCAVLFVLGKSTAKTVKQNIKLSLPLSLVSLLTACGFLVGNAVSLGQLSTSSLVKMMFAIFASVFFLVFGLCGIFKVNVPKALSLFTLPYFVFCLIFVFIRNSGMSLISENSYEILLFCFLLLFFCYTAKYICNVEKSKNLFSLIATGLVSSVFCFICTVPRYIIILLGKGSVLKTNSYPNFSTFIIGIFIAAFCFACLKPERRQRTHAASATLEFKQEGSLNNNNLEEHTETLKQPEKEPNENSNNNFDNLLTDNDFILPND